MRAEITHLSDSITCTQKLNKAQKIYDAGKLSEVEGLLASCIQSGFSKEEKMQALRLMILTSLFQDEHNKAETHLLQLLKEDPEYTLNPAIDPAEFYELYNSYRTLPVFNIGLIGGMTTSNVMEKKTYGVGSNADNKPDYQSRFGYQGGIVADILFYKNIQLHLGAILNIKNFTYNNSFLYEQATTLASKESQMWLEAPLAFKYNIGKRKLKLYAMAGGNFGLLLDANSKLSRTNSDNSNAAKEGTESFRQIRNNYNVAALVGIGLRYKVGYGYVFLDGRYSFGLSNIANVKNRYYTEDGRNLFYYGYVSSDFNINNLMISVGYMKSIYKPKKIRQLGN